MTATHKALDGPKPSLLLAAEIRAELGRAGMRQLELSRRIGRSHAWVSRRVSPTADVDMTLEDLLEIAGALGVSAEGLLASVLPRLDSNQQPSGYRFTLVRGPRDVVDLAEERAWRRAS